MSKGIDTLIVIACYEERGAGVRHKQAHELLVACVQILELVYDQVLDLR